MRITRIAVAVAAVALTSLALSPLATGFAEDEMPAEPAPASVADLGFLAGSWKGGDGTSEWEACYSTPSGGLVVSATKELKGGRAVMFDFERFQMKGETLIVVPYPFGKASKEFPLKALDRDAKKATFENAKHDFPRSLTYHRAADDQLNITLVGDMGSGEMTITLEMKKR